MIWVERMDERLVLRIGDNELPLTRAAAGELGAFLDASVADRIWASPDAVAVGALTFQRADANDRQQYPRDAKRQRVIVASGEGRWHLLPHELVAMGDAVREQLAG